MIGIKEIAQGNILATFVVNIKLPSYQANIVTFNTNIMVMVNFNTSLMIAFKRVKLIKISLSTSAPFPTLNELFLMYL